MHLIIYLDKYTGDGGGPSQVQACTQGGFEGVLMNLPFAVGTKKFLY